MAAKAFGLADRAHEIANTIDTVFAIASGTKGFTALTAMSLVQDGALSLSTTARSVLGGDLPLIDDAVTVEHLLAHRSGIGDYFDEELERPITDHVLTVPVHTLDSIEAHVPIIAGYPMKFPPGERFSTATPATACSPSSPSAFPGRRFTTSSSSASVVRRGCRTPLPALG